MSLAELCIFTFLGLGGLLLYIAVLVYSWTMVKLVRDQLKKSVTATLFVMKIIKQI